MSSNCTTVFGLFATIDTAKSSVDQIAANGFAASDISILLPDRSSRESATTPPDVPEAAVASASTGSIVGGGLGLLAGLGELVLPGFGPLVAAGPLMTTLLGVAVGGTLGGLVGALIDLGMPEYEAKLYEGSVREGGILLAVRCPEPSQIESAQKLLEACGAREVACSSEEISETGAPNPALIEDGPIPGQTSVSGSAA